MLRALEGRARPGTRLGSRAGGRLLRDSPAGRKCGGPATGFLSPSELLLLLLQLPQLPRLARTLPDELPQSELESEEDFSTHFFPGFWQKPSAARERDVTFHLNSSQLDATSHQRREVKL